MNWIKYRFLYFSISAIVIIVGIFSLVKWGLPLGVDFTGGTILEYKLDKSISTEDLTKNIQDNGLSVTAIQTTGENVYLVKLSPIEESQKDIVKNAIEDQGVSNIDELRFENVGPSIGPELIRKTVYAIAIASVLILVWVAYQFKSIKYGASAILAMFHDSFNLIGIYVLLGHFFNAEVDFLFVTALLTTLSFSVHDTIVVFDRIREIKRKYGGEVGEIANTALSETMVRSLNNSFTILFMLLALILMGGSTIRWFAVALFVGTILGTYSSPFVAVPILVTWDDLSKKYNFKLKLPKRRK